MSIVYLSFSSLSLIVFYITVGYGKTPERLTHSEVVTGERDFPYAVSIRYPYDHRCGGTIIDAIHILTAAHCVMKNEIYLVDMTVKMGSNDLYDDSNAQIRDVSLAIAHPDYDPGISWKNDIAILTLEESIIFSQYVKPIALPKKMMLIPDDIEYTAVGWGVPSDQNNDLSKTQRQLQMKIVKVDTCIYMWTTRVIDNAAQLCAIGKNSGHVSHGDSGGPLIYENMLIAVASASGSFAIVDYPDIFMRVDYYMHWIQAIIKRF